MGKRDYVSEILLRQARVFKPDGRHYPRHKMTDEDRKNFIVQECPTARQWRIALLLLEWVRLFDSGATDLTSIDEALKRIEEISKTSPTINQ